MQVGGFTESIWHFMGYMYLADAVARTPVFYEGEPLRLAPLEADHAPPEPLRGLAFDELVSLPTTIQITTGINSSGGLPKLFALPPPSPIKLAYPSLAPGSKQTAFHNDGTGFGFYSGPRTITVTYRDAGDEILLKIKQINVSSDQDLVTTDKILDAYGNPVTPAELQFDEHFAALVAQADRIAPDGIPSMMTALRAGTEDVIDRVMGRDALWAETGSPYPAGTALEAAPEGRTVDGVTGAAEPHVPTLLEIAPWRPDEPAVQTSAEATLKLADGPTGGVAALTETGLNQQVNAAGILDTNEAVGSMMVGGDYFYSRGIVQTNILVDNDHVDIAVAGALSPIVRTDGNEVHNIANFVVHESTASVGGAAGTPRWIVDTMRGDFYDVKSLVQFNGLNDSDRTVQAESGTYFDLRTGENLQINLTKFYGFSDYDVIVIGGNYHRADWIYQYNIMLDPDFAKLYTTAGDDGSTTVTSGLNSLTNKASIETYDAPAFKPMMTAHHELMDLLAGGATVLTSSPDWHLYGSSSGTLRVLYVQGDYYDVNVVTQVNFLIDGDQSIQASAHGGTQQGVASGGNSMLNDARIIDPGLLSTSNYLGGDTYEESVLIQVNIVTDSDTVTVHDTSTLVPELVAFAGQAAHGPEHDYARFNVPDPAHHDHLMSNILM